MELFSSTASSSSSMLYCCNQATIHNRTNYATNEAANGINSVVDILSAIVDDEKNCAYEKLVKCFQELSEASLLHQLARSVIEKSSDSQDMSQSRPHVVHVGNKPTRQKEHLDYASMPQVVSCVGKKQMESSTKASVSSEKRRFNEECSDDDDETDSSYDYGNQKRLRYSCLPDSSQSKVQVCEDMSEKQLWTLACNYSNLSEYRSIALALGVDETDIQVIESKYLMRDGPRECLYQCLLTWRLNQPDSCSLEQFMKTLTIRLNKSDEFIQGLRQRFASIEDYSQYRVVLGQYLSKYGLAGSDRCGMKLDEGHLWDASGLMAQHWKLIGRNLGLSELDLGSIEVKYLFTDGIRECCYQTLLLWSQVFYGQASLEFLCLRLIGMKLNLFAKQFIEVIAC